MKLSTQETATVLAALRMFQKHMTKFPDARDFLGEHFAEVAPLKPEQIDELCERINTDTDEVLYQLREMVEHPANRKINTVVRFANNQIDFRFDGYGDCGTMPGYGSPLLIEIANDELRVVIFSDINQEDPTHIISMEGAKESCRKDQL